MDLANSRWDDRAHQAGNPHRRSGRRRYAPYHDVQAYVVGDAVDVLRGWYAERWQLATGEALPARAPRSTTRSTGNAGTARVSLRETTSAPSAERVMTPSTSSSRSAARAVSASDVP